MPVVTLAVLGGSSVATPELISALLRWSDAIERRPVLRVVLLGRSLHKLERVRAMCAAMIEQAAPAIAIEATTDWRAGLSGADYVLNQMRVGGLEARAFDETFPRTIGIAGEETIGPGGFANALRTIPVVLDTMQLLAEVAPQAVVLNLTNPAGIVQQAVTRYTNVRMISLCDSPITLGHQLAKLVGVPYAQLERGYLGMNHLGWVVSLRAQGQDVLDKALEGIVQLAPLEVERDYIRATRAIPNPYVRYFTHAERMLAEQEGRTPRAHQLQKLEEELLATYAQTLVHGEQHVTVKRGAVWYDTIIVPVLDALINNLGTTWIANVVNGQHIPWLPAEVVIEVPASIDAQGAHPQSTAAQFLAADLRTILYSQAVYETLAVPAIVERDYDLAVRALVAHPLIRSIDRAEGVLDKVWPAGGIDNGRS